MKTIEEKAIKYAEEHCYIEPKLAFTDGYIQGATEQKAIDDKRYEEYLVYMNKQLTDNLASQRKTIINKACEWLDDNLFAFVEYDHLNGINIDHAQLNKQFKKAMEE